MARNRHKKVDFRPTMLDIVIPVYGQFDLLDKCIDAIPDAVGDDILYEVICVDNNSPVENAEEFYASKPIKLVQNKENLGFARACNIGARIGKGENILFLNSDVILDPNSIKNALASMKGNNGIVGFKLRFPESTDVRDAGLDPSYRPEGRVQHVGMATNIRADWIHLFVGWSLDNPKVLEVRDVYAVTGASMLTKRDVYKRVGGFLEDYGMGTYEDVDFCLSARKLGYNVIVEQSATGVHYTGASLEKYRTGFPMGMNKMIFMNRWMKELLWTEPNHL